MVKQQFLYNLPANMATITVAIKPIPALWNPHPVSIMIHKNTISFQRNVWLIVTMSTTTMTSFLKKELHKYIIIRMMFHRIGHRTQQAFCTLFERIVHFLHLFAMPWTKPVNHPNEVLVLKHLFRHFILV